jgi:hypothetical protein
LTPTAQSGSRPNIGAADTAGGSTTISPAPGTTTTDVQPVRLCAADESHREVKKLTSLPESQSIEEVDYATSDPLLTTQTPKTGLPAVQGGRIGFSNQPKVKILSNHFKISIPKGKHLYEYRIHGLTENTTRQKKRVLILDMLEMDPDLWKSRTLLATDYKTKIISCVPLIKDSSVGSESPSITVNSYVAGNRDAAPTQVKLWLETVAKHSLDGFLKYVNGEDPQFNNAAVAEAKNIIIAKAVADPADPGLAQDTFQGKNNCFYFRPGGDELSHSAGIIATRGYYSSVRPAMNNVLLNVNLVYGAFHCPATLEDCLNRARRARRREEPEARFYKRMEKHLAGLRVWVDLKRAGYEDNDEGIDSTARRTKTLRELGRTPKQQSMTVDTDQQTTVWDHLSKKYRGSDGAPKKGDETSYTGNVGESVKRDNGADFEVLLGASTQGPRRSAIPWYPRCRHDPEDDRGSSEEAR